MVTIKRDSDSSKVTITFRGAVEDDVLCTLYDNEGKIIFITMYKYIICVGGKLVARDKKP